MAGAVLCAAAAGAERDSGAGLTLKGSEDGWFEVTVRNSGESAAAVKLRVITCDPEAAWSREMEVGAHEEREFRVEKGRECRRIYDAGRDAWRTPFAAWDEIERFHAVFARVEMEARRADEVSLQVSALMLEGDRLTEVDNYTVGTKLKRSLGVLAAGWASVGNFGEGGTLEVCRGYRGVGVEGGLGVLWGQGRLNWRCGGGSRVFPLTGNGVTTVVAEGAAAGVRVRAEGGKRALLMVGWEGKGGRVREFGAESRIYFKGPEE